MLAARFEEQHGLASNLGIWCTHCREVTGELPTSRELPDASRRSKPMLANARAALGAANAGMGRSSINRFVACMDLPTIDQRCYTTADRLVRAACITAGEASQRRALLDEQLLSVEAGEAIDEQGRVPLTITYDGRWQKPGAAKNSMEGFGAAMGGRGKKVVASTWFSKDCSRCKVGAPCGNCNRTFAGPSGNMEPKMGAMLVSELNAGMQGQFVASIVTDLDSRLGKAVSEACEEAGEEAPSNLSDPNHVGKAFDGKLIPTAKRKANRRGALTTRVAQRLSRHMRAALHQHRLGGENTLKGALLNVLNHSFNRHAGCCRYFECPVALGKRTKSSFNAAGDWLDKLGGRPLEEALQREFEKRLTSDEKLRKIAHQYSTNPNESLHAMQVSMYPKRLHLAGGDGGRARQLLSNARWNDGCEASTAAVLRLLGVEEPEGSLTRLGLAEFDSLREYNRKRRSLPEVKAAKRKARKRRKKRDAPGGGARAGQAGYAANVAWDDSDDGEEEGEEEAEE